MFNFLAFEVIRDLDIRLDYQTYREPSARLGTSSPKSPMPLPIVSTPSTIVDLNGAATTNNPATQSRVIILLRLGRGDFIFDGKEVTEFLDDYNQQCDNAALKNY